MIIDNGSAHRGKRSIDRLQGTWKNLTVVHIPSTPPRSTKPKSTSVVQRQVVTQMASPTSTPVQEHLLAFGRRYEQIAAPFQSKFTRQDLHKLLAKINITQPAAHAA